MSQAWTLQQMPDLSGKIIIVTGANSGIGFEAAKAFARKGATTILACRSLERGDKALAEINAEVPDASAVVMQLDLASLASIRQFATAFLAEYQQLDLLINNAGIMMVPYGKTEDGFERQLGTNHLGHFALTGLLFEQIVNTPAARVVNISSNGHRMGNMEFDNLMYENGNGYSPMNAYGRSKLANLLFTNELQRRFVKAGSDAVATAAHPGGSDTNLANHLADRWYFKVLMPVFSVMMQSAAMGALPTLRAAVDPEARGGDYFGPSGFMETRGNPVRVEMSNEAKSESDAEKLWHMSEELTGISYG